MSKALVSRTQESAVLHASSVAASCTPQFENLCNRWKALHHFESKYGSKWECLASEGWVGMYNGERVGHKQGHFHWVQCSIAGQVTFGSYFGRPVKCGSSGTWHGHSWAEIDREVTGPTVSDLSTFPLATWALLYQRRSAAQILCFSLCPQMPGFEQILCFSLCSQIQHSETTNVLCFLLKKPFLSSGSNSGLDGEMAARTVGIEIVFSV